jgi:hypothetical protein
MARERSREVPVVVCAPRTDGGCLSGFESDGVQVICEPYEQAQVRKAIDNALAWREDHDR